MTVVLPFLLVAAVCAAVGWGLMRLVARTRRRRVSSAAMSAAMTVIDEIWHPAAVDPQIEIHQSYERQAPTPSPEDDEDDADGESGKGRVDGGTVGEGEVDEGGPVGDESSRDKD